MNLANLTIAQVQQANAIAQTLGIRPTNKTLNKVSEIAGLTKLVLPPGSAAVAAIVEVSAQILSSIFRGGPTKIEQLKMLRASNDQLRLQIRTIDDQIGKLNQALESLQFALQKNGLGFNGFLQSKKKVQQMQSFKQEQQATEQLQQMLVDKGRDLQILIELFSASIQSTYDSIYGKTSAQNILLYSMLAVGVGSLVWAISIKDK